MKKLLLIASILSTPLAFCFAKERDIANMDSVTLPDLASEFIKDEYAFNKKYNKKPLIIHHADIKSIEPELRELNLCL